MGQFLVFTLAGAFASFGEVAGNERRGTLDRPGHSMLVGLVAAALGIKRDEANRLQKLSDSCRFAVRTDHTRGLLVDYHTVQSAKRRRNFAPATRKQMLEEGERTTIITRREYMMDVRYTVALSVVSREVELDAICASLRAPKFSLYLGRRSCPPSLPLMPAILDADAPEAAFSHYDNSFADRIKSLWPLASSRHKSRGFRQVAADSRMNDPQGDRRGVAGLLERRRTLPVDRKTWRFDSLDELVLAPVPEKPEKEDR